MRPLNEVCDALRRSAFRRRQRLSPADGRYLARRGLPTVMSHARRLVGARLAPAHPPNDGSQTPMRGHPVFTAQHATATCCRNCLAKWHGIGKGRPLREAEVEHVLAAIERWLAEQEHDLDAAGDADRTLWE